MDGRPLEHLELITLAEKDEHYYKKWIGDDIQEIAQRCMGVRRWIKFRNAITVFSRFGYFLGSLLYNRPTPGEEFCGVNVSEVSLARKLLMVALNNDLQLSSEVQYIKLVKDVHLITFFLFGDFYELAKRVADYSYSTSDTASYQSKHINKIMGCITLAQLFLNPPVEPSETDVPRLADIAKSGVEIPSPSDKADTNKLCQLCSSVRQDPTSTLCGHVFCWTCIQTWVRNRGECPICRTPTEPSRLIHLINFR